MCLHYRMVSNTLIRMKAITTNNSFISCRYYNESYRSFTLYCYFNNGYSRCCCIDCINAFYYCYTRRRIIVDSTTLPCNDNSLEELVLERKINLTEMQLLALFLKLSIDFHIDFITDRWREITHTKIGTQKSKASIKTNAVATG